MTRAMTCCPTCFEGKTYERCDTCDGRGVVPDGIDGAPECGRCGGSGEIERDGCATCGGAGEIRWGHAKILETLKYVGEPAPNSGPYRRWVIVQTDVRAQRGFGGFEVLEAEGVGSTSRSLAAWNDLRAGVRDESVTSVRGTTSWLVRDLDGRRTIPTAALIIETPRTALYLTGCSWGYGGEGPNGTAAILDDLGLFATFDDALAYVTRVPMNEDWDLSIPEPAESHSSYE